MKNIESLAEYTEILTDKTVSLFYFSHEKCNVCKVLKPKVELFIKERFPKAELSYVQIDEQLEIAAQNSVFTAPTLLIYFEGKETFRYSRNFSTNTIENDMSRSYKMIFDTE